MPKVQLIDRVGNGGATGIAASYFVLLAIWLIAGSQGPAPNDSFTVPANPGSNLVCTNPTSCMVTWYGSLYATRDNQNIQLVMTAQRPISSITNTSIGLAQGYSYNLIFSLDLSSGGVPIVSNSTHVATMMCAPGSTTCGTATILQLSFLTQTNFACVAAAGRVSCGIPTGRVRAAPRARARTRTCTHLPAAHFVHAPQRYRARDEPIRRVRHGQPERRRAQLDGVADLHGCAGAGVVDGDSG